MNREIQILKRTYKDKMKVLRSVQKVNKDTGKSIYEEKVIYDNEPCACSLSSVNVPERNDISTSQKDSYKIFTLPHIRIKKNDIVIIEHAGDFIKGVVSNTHVYESHCECTMEVGGKYAT